MSYKSEFPDYDGEFYLPDGWMDNSWHNDTMPRAMLRIENAEGIREYNIWQDYIDKDKRERDVGKRYMFQIEVNYLVVFSYETNKLKNIKKLVKGVYL